MKRIHLNALRRLRKAQDKVLRSNNEQISLSINTGTDGSFYTFAHNKGKDVVLMEIFGDLWTPTDADAEQALARLGDVLGIDV